MAKHDRRTSRRQPPTSRSVSIQVPLPVLGVLAGVRQAFHGLCIRTGMQVLQAMMEADREALCGPKGRHQAARTAWRGGSVGSQVTLGGRQVALASFQWAAATDPLEAHTLEAVAAGVTTRQYARTLDPVPADVSERATSRSAVSRRFVALSAERLQAFVSRPLGELGLRVVCIDGKVFRDHCIVIALGIDAQGRKHVLGLREGATETAAVATDFPLRLGHLRPACSRHVRPRPGEFGWRRGAAEGGRTGIRLRRGLRPVSGGPSRSGEGPTHARRSDRPAGLRHRVRPC